MKRKGLLRELKLDLPESVTRELEQARQDLGYSARTRLVEHIIIRFLARHQRRTKTAVAEQEQLHACPYCLTSLPTDHALVAHLAETEDTIECYCGVVVQLSRGYTEAEFDSRNVQNAYQDPNEVAHERDHPKGVCPDCGVYQDDLAYHETAYGECKPDKTTIVTAPNPAGLILGESCPTCHKMVLDLFDHLDCKPSPFTFDGA